MKNYKQIDSIKYGLPKRIKIVEISKDHIGIVKMRKSRIIMKDGVLIIDIADSLRNTELSINVSLIISGPICSKTIKLLNSNSIDIIRNSIFD